MKFIISVIFPVLLGLLFSCSSGKQHFFLSSQTGNFHPAEAVSTNSTQQDFSKNTDTDQEIILASAETGAITPLPAKPKTEFLKSEIRKSDIELTTRETAIPAPLKVKAKKAKLANK